MPKRRGEDARQILGRDAKRLRSHVSESRRVLSENADLCVWHARATKWERDAETTQAQCHRLSDMVEQLPCLSAIPLQEACADMSEIAHDILEKMDRLRGRHCDGILEETLANIERFVLRGGRRDHDPSAKRVAIRKFHFFADREADCAVSEVDALNRVHRPSLIEDSDDELQEKLWKDAFKAAKRAVVRGTAVCDDSPFNTSDANFCASALLDRIKKVQRDVALFDGLGRDPERRQYVQRLTDLLLAKDYLKILPKKICGICLEAKINAVRCGDCSQAVCADCFHAKLAAQAAHGWQDAGAIVRFTCDFCWEGQYHESLRSLLPPQAQDLYIQAVRADELKSAARFAAQERSRELGHTLRLQTADEILHDAIKRALVDHVAIRTPCCSRVFVEIEGCCAIECCDCRAKFFCGLCLEGGSWDRAEAHRHVETCGARPAKMTDAHFLPLNDWKNHMATRQHRLVQEWLRDRLDISDELKHRLLREEFPLPDAPLDA